MLSYRLLTVLFVFIFLAGPYSLTSAQFEDEMDGFHSHDQQQQQQQQQQITLTRDAIERLLQSLSSNCRVEMEGALATQTQDVSDPCKVEIQEALKLLSPNDFVTPGQQHMMSADEEGYDSMMQGDDDPFAAPSNRRAPNTKSEGGLSPSIAIAAFVITLLAAAGGFIFYRNSVSPSDNAKSPAKKLSKKKEEKLRQKAAQRGY